ncbi:hir1 [Gossypium arboreum]|uniref:Uncharacterized protein n=2 Tax=Gossypium arboreum TaxID=29729 RepID=A0ABR0NUU1_GOSAR|nr:uncharacterized protein LOC108456815 [Gossypium arboreum]KAK5805135.1 hypothetical protein PVK06_032787 [Gossypium arboreum]KHG21448.1 hir1 [Gossypium arboreum]
MEIIQSWRCRLSFKNATIALNIFNVIVALFLLQWFLSSASSRTRPSSNHPNSVGFDYIKEAEEMRIAMQPLELIKRVKEIQREAYIEPETIQPKDAKQTAAVDLSKRLQDFRSLNDASSLKALEEWRKRKMERARQREMEKNGTLVTKE